MEKGVPKRPVDLQDESRIYKCDASPHRFQVYDFSTFGATKQVSSLPGSSSFPSHLPHLTSEVKVCEGPKSGLLPCNEVGGAKEWPLHHQLLRRGGRAKAHTRPFSTSPKCFST